MYGVSGKRSRLVFHVDVDVVFCNTPSQKERSVSMRISPPSWVLGQRGNIYSLGVIPVVAETIHKLPRRSVVVYGWDVSGAWNDARNDDDDDDDDQEKDAVGLLLW